MASRDDKYSYDSVIKLKSDAPKTLELITYTTGGHGTNLFKTQPEILDKIISQLRQYSATSKNAKNCQ